MRLTPIVAAIVAAGFASSAFAQTAAPQRVEITGSSIKRIATEGALPLQVITREELEQQGILSAEQLISVININGNGLDNLASNADVVSGQARGNNGASSANLRGQLARPAGTDRDLWAETAAAPSRAAPPLGVARPDP